MKPDDLEQRLQRVLLRPPPAAWRADILATARAAAGEAAREPELALPWWQEWFGFSRLTWGGLAAAWVVILALYCSTPATERKTAENQAGAGEPGMALLEQQRLLTQLLEPEPPHVQPAEPPKIPGPRSQRREAWVIG